MITDWGGREQSRVLSAPDFIQIRDKALEARDLYVVTLALLASREPGTKIIVNSRLDVALAAKADGVHLPAGSPAPDRLRPLCPSGFLIGVSCHSVDEVLQAHNRGADYCLFGPVFAPLSKSDARPTQGIEGLRQAVNAAPIPVFALGGIQEIHDKACAEVGAAGIAGISMFIPRTE